MRATICRCVASGFRFQTSAESLLHKASGAVIMHLIGWGRKLMISLLTNSASIFDGMLSWRGASSPLVRCCFLEFSSPRYAVSSSSPSLLRFLLIICSASSPSYRPSSSFVTALRFGMRCTRCRISDTIPWISLSLSVCPLRVSRRLSMLSESVAVSSVQFVHNASSDVALRSESYIVLEL